jgi:Family of unknown function (DUF6220)
MLARSVTVARKESRGRSVCGGAMRVARKIFVGLAWLFVLAVAIQFLLAGLGVLGGESLEPHRLWGFSVLHLLPILMLIAAIVGRMGRTVIVLTVVLFLLVFLQPLFADPELDPRWLRSLHVLNALFIFALGYHVAQRGTKTVRGDAGRGLRRSASTSGGSKGR